jgi:serine/threonine-protein kinase
LGPDGSIYVTEHGNNDVRRIFPDGQVETVLPYEYERLHHPSGIAVAADGTIYLADTGGARLLELGIDGSFRVVAGTGSPGFADGPGGTAQLDTPTQLEWVAPGTLFFADKANAAVRKVELR